MSLRETRRQAALERMAAHLLAEGMAGASLRPMAAAAGISDRMLLYYFRDKQEVLEATLGLLAARLAEALATAGIGPRPMPFARLLAEVATRLGTPAMQPFMRLWLELAASAGRGQQPQRAVAERIATGFLGWIAERLAVPDAERPRQSALLLAMVEGMLVLESVGHGGTAALALAAQAGRD